MKDNKTVIRVGSGSTMTRILVPAPAGASLSRPGRNGRVQVQNTALINTFPGIFDISAGVKPLPVRRVHTLWPSPEYDHGAVFTDI